MENLIEWCEDLDYDKYIENWHIQATSAKPLTQDDDKQVHIYDAGLGDITIGLAKTSGTLSNGHLTDMKHGTHASGTASHRVDVGALHTTANVDASKLGSQLPSLHQDPRQNMSNMSGKGGAPDNAHSTYGD